MESSGYSTRVSDSAARRLGQCADEIAAAELLEVEIIGRGGGPEAQRVDGLAAVADDGPVERDADQGRGPAGNGVASLPPCISNEQLSLTSTVSCGRATSHGSGGAASCPAARAASRPGSSA